MQKNRLFKIIYYLLNNKHTTANKLAEEFEVSIRTIYRDIDVLSSVGIPIYTETGRNGGIYLIDNFVLDKSLLSHQEKQDILLALQSQSMLNNLENDILEKLSALFNLHTESWCEVDFSRWGNNQDNKKFELLKTAIFNHFVIEIHYINTYSNETKRKVQPLKMLYKTNGWYLKSFCLLKHDYRMFKFNRIVDMSLLDESFIPTPYPEICHQNSLAYNEIILHFDKCMAQRVYDEFDSTEIEKQNNEDLLVTTKMPEDAWLISFLLSFGSLVEVIKPVYLREEIAKEAKKIIEKYKS